MIAAHQTLINKIDTADFLQQKSYSTKILTQKNCAILQMQLKLGFS